jgi:hypothetical protein
VKLQTGIPTKGKVSPYLSARAGYALGGGLLLNPEIGILIRNSGKKSLYIAAGYEYQQVGQDYYDKDVESSIGLTVGIRF